jgi:hypothetical protein
MEQQMCKSRPIALGVFIFFGVTTCQADQLDRLWKIYANRYAQLIPQNCDDLWYQRNSVYKDAGFCFKTPRGIRAFGNAGCQFDNESDVPLSERQRQMINDIKRAEAARNCPK